MRSTAQLLIATVCLLGLCASCADNLTADTIDPAGNMTRRDYLALRKRGKADQEQKTEDSLDEDNLAQPDGEPPIPPLPAPVKPVFLEETNKLPAKKVSVTLTENVALRDVLIEFGRESGINMEIDPRIQGGIIFTAKNQPFDLVLKRICALAALRYSVEDSFVRIELDEPYQHTYTLDYLSLSRHTTSEVTIATNVFDVDVSGGNGGSSSTSNNRGSGSGGNDNNSIAKIAGAAEADFWSEVEKSLPQVLVTATRNKTMLTGKTEENNAQKANFSLDKQAGLITIFGNEQQQRAVQRYLERLQHKASAQVLIEARIVEVELTDEFQSGINWSSVFGKSLNLAADFGAPGAGAAMTTATSGLFSAGLDTGDFSGILKLVRTFGTTRVLSSPRLTVMNNQTAVLKVARNEVYFLTSAQFPTTTNNSGVVVSGTPVFSSTPRTVPVGLVMTVQPAINTDSGRVTMTLRPTISRVVDRVNDPSIGLNAAYSGNSATVQSQIPVLAVREMDSVLQLQSGEVAVMGGLMQDSSENQDQGVPPLDTLPVVGYLARSRDNQGHTSELVILLRATILKNPKPDAVDTNLYEKYNRDPRPFEIPET